MVPDLAERGASNSRRLLGIGFLLSACGLGLLALDVAWELQESTYLRRQGIAHIFGVACCALFMSGWWERLDPVDSVPLVAGAVVLMPPELFFIDRDLPVQMARALAVVAAGALLKPRLSARVKRRSVGRGRVLWLSISVAGLAVVALFQRGFPPALVIVFVAALMIRSAGRKRAHMMLPLVMFALLASAIIATVATEGRHPAARVKDYVRVTLTMPFEHGGRLFLRTYYEYLSILKPPALSQLVLARVAQDAGYPLAAAICSLFAYVGWIGFREANQATDRGVRVLLVGVTALLVAPAALHVFGCVVLLQGCGLLPFVSYAPAAVVVDWSALGVAAALVRSR